MVMGQNPVPLVNIPKMIIIVFIGMFTYPILMVIGINPWPYGKMMINPWISISRYHLFNPKGFPHVHPPKKKKDGTLTPIEVRTRPGDQPQKTLVPKRVPGGAVPPIIDESPIDKS